MFDFPQPGEIYRSAGFPDVAVVGILEDGIPWEMPYRCPDIVWNPYRRKFSIWKPCRRPAACIWGTPVSSRVITVNTSITPIWPTWRQTATGMYSV